MLLLTLMLVSIEEKLWTHILDQIFLASVSWNTLMIQLRTHPTGTLIYSTWSRINYLSDTSPLSLETGEQYFEASLKRNNLVDPQILPVKHHSNHLNILETIRSQRIYLKRAREASTVPPTTLDQQQPNKRVRSLDLETLNGPVYNLIDNQQSWRIISQNHQSLYGKVHIREDITSYLHEQILKVGLLVKWLTGPSFIMGCCGFDSHPRLDLTWKHYLLER